jgi:nucleoside-diphosphate-sugar epimerase
MKIFITGASGFVGGATVTALKNGHEIYAMARSSSSAEKVKRLGAIPVLCELGKVEPTHLQGMDVVIHAAAHVDEWGQREVFWRINVEGTQQLLDTCRKAGVKRFIHISTEALLFNGQDLIDIDETYPPPAHTPFLYSETKREAEKLVKEAGIPGVFETIILRPRLIWGPGDQTILPKVKEKIKQGGFKWIGGGQYKTSATHIDNLMAAIQLALTKGNNGEIYFITDDEVHTYRSFFEGYLGAAGVTIKAGNVPKGLARFLSRTMEFFWKLVRAKNPPPITRFTAYMMSSHFVLKNDKAKRELGYKPVVDFAEGLRRTKSWLERGE